MKSLLLSKFGGINTGNSPYSHEATDLLNVRADEGALFVRPGTQNIGNIGLGKVRKLKEIKNHLFAVQEGELKRFTGTSWENSGITGIDIESIPQFLNVYASSGINLHTGTISFVEEGAYLIQDSTKSFSENDLVDKYIKIVSGKGTGQVRRIVANTDKDILIADPWDITPEGASYVIQVALEITLFTNGLVPPKQNDDIASNTWSDILDIPFFDFIIEYKGRYIGARRDSRTVYISTIRGVEDFPYLPEIPKDEGYITGLVKFGNQLVVFLDNSVWVTEFESPTELEFIERAENYGCVNSETIAVGEGFLFFLSDRGIEVFNTLETKLLEGHVAFSDYRLRELRNWDKSKAAACTFDGKYFCSIGTKTIVFDTLYYLRSLEEEGRRSDYVFLIDEGYVNDCFCEFEGALYSGGQDRVVRHSLNYLDDDGVSFNRFWVKGKIDLKEPKRRQALISVTAETEPQDNTESLGVEVKSDMENKVLDDMELVSNVTQISGKRSRGRTHIVRLNLQNLKRAKVRSVEALFEQGRF